VDLTSRLVFLAIAVKTFVEGQLETKATAVLLTLVLSRFL